MTTLTGICPGSRLRTTQLVEKKRLIRKANPKVLCFAGVPCSGKSTLVSRLMQRHPQLFYQIIRSTSRQRRPEESAETSIRFMSQTDYDFYFSEGTMFWSEQIFGNSYGYHVLDILSAIESEKIIIFESAPTLLLMKHPYLWAGMQGKADIWNQAEKHLIFISPASITDIKSGTGWATIQARLRKRLLTRDPNISREELHARTGDRVREELGFWAFAHDFAVENDGSRSIDEVFEEVEGYVMEHILAQ